MTADTPKKEMGYVPTDPAFALRGFGGQVCKTTDVREGENDRIIDGRIIPADTAVGTQVVKRTTR